MPAHSNGNGNGSGTPSEPLDFEGTLVQVFREHRDFAKVASERFQTLHDRQVASEAKGDRRHEAMLKIVTDLSNGRLQDRYELDAIGRHVKALPTKSELTELGAQVGRHQLDSVTTELRQDEAIKASAEKIKRVERMAMLKRGAWGSGIAIGAVVIWEWRHIIEAVLRIAHGATP